MIGQACKAERGMISISSICHPMRNYVAIDRVVTLLLRFIVPGADAATLCDSLGFFRQLST